MHEPAKPWPTITTSGSDKFGFRMMMDHPDLFAVALQDKDPAHHKPHGQGTPKIINCPDILCAVRNAAFSRTRSQVPSPPRSGEKVAAGRMRGLALS